MSQSAGRDRFDEAEELLGDFMARVEAGEASQQGGLDSLLQQRPDLEAELRQLWSECGGVEQAFGLEADAHQAAQAAVEAMLEGVESPTDFSQRYQIVGEIGRGGMGAILRIVDRRFDRPMAMKVIVGQASGSTTGKTPAVQPHQVARFLNEARITGQLSHPGIVPVHEVGRDPEGRAYFTMKLVEGLTLGQIFERQAKGDPAWPMPRVLTVIERVCEAMAFAHQHGVIHRDLKPANVMVGSLGETYVMDWGLARRLADEGELSDEELAAKRVTDEELSGLASVTVEGHVLGTPAYMSPEQARGEIAAMGPPSDVYSIGTMLYQLIAGRPPHFGPDERPSAAEVLNRAKAGPPIRLASPTTPPELIAICEKAMSPAPRDRYATVKELADDLQRFVSGRTVKAFDTGAWAETKKWVQRNKALTASISATIAATAVGAVSFALMARDATSARNDLLQKNTELIQTVRELNTARQNAEDAADEARASALQTEASFDLMQRFLSAGDPYSGGNAQLTVVEAMVAVADDLKSGRSELDAPTRANLMRSAAVILARNGEPDISIELASDALALNRSAPSTAHKTAEFIDSLGFCLQSAGLLESALPHHQAAAEVFRLGNEPKWLARSLTNLAGALYRMGRYDDALPLLAEAYELARQERDNPSAEFNNLTACLLMLGCTAEANAIASVFPIMPEQARDVESLEACLGVGRVLAISGERKRAADLIVPTLPQLLRLLQRETIHTASAWSTLAEIALEEGRAGEAIDFSEQALAAYRTMDSVPESDRACCIRRIGLGYLRLNDTSKAAELIDEAISIHRSAFRHGHPNLAESLYAKSLVLAHSGRNEECKTTLEEGLQMLESIGWSSSALHATFTNDMAVCHYKLHNYREALLFAQDSMNVRSAVLGPNHRHVAKSLRIMGAIYLGLGQAADSRDAFARSTAIVRSLDNIEWTELRDSVRGLAASYSKLGEPGLEIESLENLIEHCGTAPEHQVEKVGYLKRAADVCRSLGNLEQQMAFEAMAEETNRRLEQHRDQ